MHRSWIVAGLLLAAAPAVAQEQPDPKTLLSQATLNAIANQLSGAQALHNVMEMCPYERNRPAEEYQRHLPRSGVRRGQGEGVRLQRRPHRAIPARLQTVGRGDGGAVGHRTRHAAADHAATVTSRRRLPPAATARTSPPIRLRRPRRSADDYKDKDVKGKIVLCSGPVGAAHNLAVRQFGAEGVVSFFNATGKPIDRPDQIGWSGIGGGPGAAPPPRVGAEDDVGLHPVAADGPRPAVDASRSTST